jgi:CheY-like chemotaxis protein
MLNKLFIIDDDYVTVKICEMLVTNTKFAKELISFNDGSEAIDYFSKYFERKKKGEVLEALPDFILLDLNMPVMDGWGFLENYIRKYADRLPDIKIAILSSSVNPEDFIRSQEYPIVVDFIHKPLIADFVEEMKSYDTLKHFFNKN